MTHLPSLHEALLSLEGQLSCLNDAGRRDRRSFSWCLHSNERRVFTAVLHGNYSCLWHQTNYAHYIGTTTVRMKSKILGQGQHLAVSRGSLFILLAWILWPAGYDKTFPC